MTTMGVPQVIISEALQEFRSGHDVCIRACHPVNQNITEVNRRFYGRLIDLPHRTADQIFGDRMGCFDADAVSSRERGRNHRYGGSKCPDGVCYLASCVFFSDFTMIPTDVFYPAVLYENSDITSHRAADAGEFLLFHI